MTHVKKRTAILLKEKGFDLPCRQYFDYREELQGTQYDDLTKWSMLDGLFSAPTLHEAADWLRTNSVHVYVTCTYSEWYYSIQDTTGISLFNSTTPYDTHDLALEAGIVHALKNYVK